MGKYRVRFFKTLTNSYGKSFEVCQRSLDVHSACNPDRAVDFAKRHFEHLEHVPDWSLHADYIEVGAIPEVIASPGEVVTESLRVSGN